MFGSEGYDEVPYQAASVWASCVAIVAAIEAAQSGDASSVADQLDLLDLDTVFGRVNFDSDGLSTNDFRVVQYQENKSIAEMRWMGFVRIHRAQDATRCGTTLCPRGSSDLASWRCHPAMEPNSASSQHCPSL